MLERLFGSKIRLELLIILLANPDRFYRVKELVKRLGSKKNSITKELKNLEKIGLIKRKIKKGKKCYQADEKFILFEELRLLILKSGAKPEERIINKIEKLGDIKLAILTGVFTKNEEAKTDLLIVGKVDQKRLDQFLSEILDELNQEVDYTVMNTKEFNYRKELGDHFIKDILNLEHLVAIDRL